MLFVVYAEFLAYISSRKLSSLIKLITLPSQRQCDYFFDNYKNVFFFSLYFQILATDRLSNRICHACISFLNSWQSFKNRCFAAQKKQQNFLELLLAKERAKQKLQKEQQRQLLQAGTSIDQQKILKNALLNSTMRSSTVNDSSIDVVSVNQISV